MVMIVIETMIRCRVVVMVMNGPQSVFYEGDLWISQYGHVGLKGQYKSKELRLPTLVNLSAYS